MKCENAQAVRDKQGRIPTKYVSDDLFLWSHSNHLSTSRKYQFSNGQMQKCHFNFQLGESHKNLHHLAAGVDDSSSVYLALFQIKPKLQASSKVLSFRENSKILTCNITNWCQNSK